MVELFWSLQVYRKKNIEKTLTKKATTIVGSIQEKRLLKRWWIVNCKNKPGTAQVGAISKAQKLQKLNGIGASVGTLRDFSSILSQWMERGTLWWFFFWKILTMPKKLKEGTLWDFATSICRKTQKKLKEGQFGENFFSIKKVSQCRKKTEKGTLQSRPVLYITR